MIETSRIVNQTGDARTQYNIFATSTHLSWLRVCLLFFVCTSFFTSSADAPRIRYVEEDHDISLRVQGPLHLAQVYYDDLVTITTDRASAIDLYFQSDTLPLQHNAKDFVSASDAYGLDWRLLAAISFIESTGGKHACITADYNPFGWNSCRTNFTSYTDAIWTVARHLSGNHPNTEYFYKDKELRGILESYNPPSVVPDYADKVIREMERIEEFL